MKDITKMELVVENLSFLGDAKPRETETKTPASRRRGRPPLFHKQSFTTTSWLFEIKLKKLLKRNLSKNCKENNYGQVPIKPFRLRVPRVLPRRLSGCSPGRRNNLHIQWRWNGMCEQRFSRRPRISVRRWWSASTGGMHRKTNGSPISLRKHSGALLFKPTERRSPRDPQALIHPRTNVRCWILWSRDGERASRKGPKAQKRSPD